MTFTQPDSPKKHYTADDKVRLLRKLLLDGCSIANICEEEGLSAEIIYGWQAQLFEQGYRAFESELIFEYHLKRRLAELENDLNQKDKVITKLTAEITILKGESIGLKYDKEIYDGVIDYIIKGAETTIEEWEKRQCSE